MATATQLADVATIIGMRDASAPASQYSGMGRFSGRSPQSGRAGASLEASPLERGTAFAVGSAQLCPKDPKDRMPPWVSLLTVLTFQLLIVSGMTIIYPTALSFSEKLGAGASFSGVMVAARPFAAMLGTYPMQKVMDKLPLQHVFFFQSAGQVLANVLYACAGLTHSKYILLVARILMGLSSQNSPVLVYISRTVGLHHRSWVMMTLSSVMGAGYVLGPFLAFLSSVFCKELRIDNLILDQNTLPGWLMAFLWFVLLVVQPFLIVEPATDARTDRDLRPHRPETTAAEAMLPGDRLPVLAIAFLLFMQGVGGMLLGMWEVFVATYCTRAWGWSDEAAGLYMACVMGALLTACVSFGLRISKKFPDRQVLLCCCLGATGAAILCFDFGFTNIVNISIFTTGSFIMLSCTNIFRGSINSLNSKVVPDSMQNQMSTWITMTAFLGRGIGPLLATQLGVQAYASTNLCIMAISSLGTFLLFKQLKPHAKAT